MRKPTIVWLDDQLVKLHRNQVQAYFDCLTKHNINLLEASSITTFADYLRSYSSGNKEGNSKIDGFVIDLMLTHLPGQNNFSALGLPDMRLKATVGGAQVLQILRGDNFENHRKTYEEELLMQYVATPCCLLSASSEGADALKHYRLDPNQITCFWKDNPETTDSLLNGWVNSLRDTGA